MLIANTLSKYTEDDKEWLLTQEADVIEKMFPNEPVKEEAPQLNEDEKKQVIEDYKKTLPVVDTEVQAYGKKRYDADREKMSKSILANTEDIYTDADFKEKSMDALEKLYKATLKDDTDFSLLGGNVERSKIKDNEEEPLFLPGIEIKEEAKN